MNRVPMNLPGTQHVIHVPDDRVAGYVELGWRKLRRRSDDTGSVPIQTRH